MNIDQQRDSFEAWIKTHCDYDDLDRSEMMLAFDAWQAALASPQVQALRKDAERLDWTQEQAKQSRSGVGFDWRPAHIEEGQVLEMKGWRFMRHHFLGDRKPNIREAIDHARRNEGEGK